MLRWYQAKLAQRPLLTQAITSAVLFATGDSIAQQAVEKRGTNNHDWYRTGRMALYGGAIFGPAATTFYKVLNTRMVFPGRPNLQTLTHVGFDQLMFAPINLSIFLSSMALLEGTDPKKKLETTYWPALSSNWIVWPWIQFANFKFVPLQYRVIVVNFLSIGWNCYLSALNSAGGKQQEEDQFSLG